MAFPVSSAPSPTLRPAHRTAEAAIGMVIVWLCFWTSFASAQSLETSAREAILIDMSTGTVLLEHNADQRMPTASMSKIMTMYMVFEAIEQGRLSLDDRLPVSERAWRKGGSKMFVEVGDQIRVEDLIRGVIVQSGNDASIVFAEALAGTEEAFARLMTERAHDLGLNHSNFANATGWPDPSHYSTAADLALLAQHLITEFPQFYHYYSELEFTYAGITQANRNPLLYQNVGADGLKTGHTNEAGYGLTASARQGDRRLVMVINGLSSARARSDEAVRLMNWGFREFETRTLFEAGEVVDRAEVWLGDRDTVPLVLAEDLAVTVRRTDADEVDLRVRLAEPMPAPIAMGDTVATLVVDIPGLPERTVPLFAGADVDRQGFAGRVLTQARQLVIDALR